ncbi:MAG: hypothetical protein KC619_22170 [Myxococcales bacterium]|nr:hypothetical protein [Myxococcales bacterium]
MTRAGPLRCVVVGEDAAHAEIAAVWVKRRVLEERDWARDIDWSDLLVWERDEAGPRPYFKHQDVKRWARGSRRVRIRFDKGDPSVSDEEGHMFLRALIWAQLQGFDVVVLGRDVDGRLKRRDGFRRAIRDRSWSLAVLGLLAEPESEAWYLAGFVPTSKGERDALAAVRERLRFDPTEHPHRLTSTVPGGRKDAKSVLDDLVGADTARRRDCLEAPFDRLRRVGVDCGIVDFLDQVDDRLLPLV